MSAKRGLDLAEKVALKSGADFAVANRSLSRQCMKAACELYKYDVRFSNDIKTLDVDFDTEHQWEELRLIFEPWLQNAENSISKLENVEAATLPYMHDEEDHNSHDESEASFIEDEEKDGNFSDTESKENEEEVVEEMLQAQSDGKVTDEEGVQRSGSSDESGDDDSDEEQEHETSATERTAEDREPEVDEQLDGVRRELDDEFFKVDEMEEFLERSEKLDADGKIFPDEADEDEEEDDLGEDDLEVESEEGLEDEALEDEALDEQQKGEAEGKELKYADFFNNNASAGSDLKENNQLFDVESEEADEETKTAHQLKQERLRRQIDKLENEAIGQKSWLMKGEVTGDRRPVNSLLEATLDYNVAAKPTPVATEEKTEELEDLIRKRIADSLFDDVVRRAVPIAKKKRVSEVLSQEKPKEGLAEVYEKQYLAARNNQQQENDSSAVKEEEPTDPRHQEIDKLFTKLCRKLDALSALHFTPKVEIPDQPRPVKNVSAITMEDAVPDATSDAMMLAPGEVYKVRDPIRGELETSKEERKAKRRRMKAKAKSKKIRKEEKIRAAEAADPLEKARKEEKLAAATAAKAKRNSKGKRGEFSKTKSFFGTLQESAKNEISRRSHTGAGDAEPTQRTVRLKL